MVILFVFPYSIFYSVPSVNWLFLPLPLLAKVESTDTLLTTMKSSTVSTQTETQNDQKILDVNGTAQPVATDSSPTKTSETKAKATTAAATPNFPKSTTLLSKLTPKTKITAKTTSTTAKPIVATTVTTTKMTPTITTTLVPCTTAAKKARKGWGGIFVDTIVELHDGTPENTC